MEATGYSSREAAGLFGFTPARVRAMARAGILSPSRDPRRHYRFSFQDLVLLRAARSLLDDPAVPNRQVHRTLRGLVIQLPDGRRPSEVQLFADGGRVLIRDGGMVWQADTGQLNLDFRADGGGAIAQLPTLELAELAAEDWYQRGLDLEPLDPEAASAAYAQAISCYPAHAKARVNLGRLLQAAGDPAAAVTHYRAALDAEPRLATAAFNLGTALDELGRASDAIEAYRTALTLNPALADAHYNLSELYHRTGHKLAALLHLKRYRELAGPH